jgi:hypothetical protein
VRARWPRRLMPCLVAAAAAMASGCGTGADRDQARAAAERFYAAVRQHDGRTACEQLSSSLRAQLVKDQPGDDCATAVLHLSLHGSRAAAVRVYATAGEVVLAGGDTVFLGDTRQGWRLDAVGCKPQGSGPFDCEEQA